MKLAYELHIHTAASPCGDEWMTPNNIVNMSLLKGFDVIAITDHQTVANCESVMKVGKQKGLYVIPGIEIECMEEFHLIALFKTLENAKAMERWLSYYMPPLKNRIDVFGHQTVLDETDKPVREIEAMLLVAARISASHIIRAARKLGAVVYPAHIDRDSYSIISNLGSIPEEYAFNMIEISKAAAIDWYKKDYKNYTIIQSSDAHYLEDIAEREHLMEKEEFERIGIHMN